MDAVEAIAKAEDLLRNGRPASGSDAASGISRPLPLSSPSNPIYKANANGTQVRLIQLQEDTEGRSLDVLT